MNPEQPPSALHDESAYSAAGAPGGPGGPTIFPEEIEDAADSAYAWVLIVGGLLAAGAMAYVLCRLPMAMGNPLPLLTRSGLLGNAIKYIALTAAAGAVGTWMLWRVLTAKPPFGSDLLIRHAVVGWMFLPAILLLQRVPSRWMLLVVALAAAEMAASLRQLFSADVEATQEDGLAQPAGDLQMLYGLPSSGSDPLRSFVIALCAQVSLLFAVMGYLVFAGVLLAVFVGLLIWRLSSAGPRTAGATSDRWTLSGQCSLAIFVTVLALVPWMVRPLRMGATTGEVLLRQSMVHMPEFRRPDSSYVSVVLWPPKPPKKIVAPVPRAAAFARGVMTKPLLIPFDGPYWYFEAPFKEPGQLAHVAQGLPTDAGINMRSTDGEALFMEAHQHLGRAIDLKCCSEIDVAITNADTRPGRIMLGLRLTDSTAPRTPSRFLDLQVIASSDVVHIPLNRPPVGEVVRFPIARSGAMRRFDEITVIFLPEWQHSQRGAKVAIQSFTLVPR